MKLWRRRPQGVARDVRLGRDVTLRPFINLYGCEIGDGSQVGTFVEIQRGARIGRNCKISSHSFICEGVTIEDDVFVGHNVVFINDRYPRAVNASGKLQGPNDWQLEPTVVRSGASLGSGAVILGGITVGASALVGAGAVVTKDVPDGTIVVGNPAKALGPVTARPARS